MSILFDQVKIASLINEHYGIQGAVRQLPGELDLNFQLITDAGKSYIFKIANVNEQRINLELQNAAINHLITKKFGLIVSSLVLDRNGLEILNIKDEQGQIRMARLLTWVDGRVFASANPQSPDLLKSLGEMCGNLCRSLEDFEHPAAHRFMKWDPQQTAWIQQHIHRFSDHRKQLVQYFFDLFEQGALPLFPKLRKSINYNDANDYNVLISHDTKNPVVQGVIDFGDLVFTQTVNELAIALAYAIMDKPDPLEAACHVVNGFNEKFKLTGEELKALFPLMAARLIISVTSAELNRSEFPENTYLQVSDRPAWVLLEKLRTISPAFAEYAFRSVCGLSPCPTENQFVDWARKNFANVKSPVNIPEKYRWLDLSVGSLEMGNSSNFLDTAKLEERVASGMRGEQVTMAIGKYNEARAIYATPAYEVEGNDGPVWRTVHIGLDFFCRPSTAVRAVLDGVVHSFANNNRERDYGPTIILKHTVGGDLIFYTLYGHLSIGSLQTLKVGKSVKAGECIGYTGSYEENGNWPPHLHFQVMLDTLGMMGDFPGVCFPQQLRLWKSICPDPWLLLQGNESPSSKSLSKDEIVSYRKQHLGKNLSISYHDPLMLLRGAGAFLMDSTGRRYLDTVNNVAHVGHEHPRVVEAGQRQMAVLNTNTRYLHENLVKFVEELLSTMPPELDVAFLVNSGSEANELALRLAKTFTNQKDMVVSEVGYHGNTNACVEISSYKFDGPGGQGAQSHIHVVPIPDTFRGIYRSDDPDAGSKYARHVQSAIEKIQNEGRNVAALIFESVISCGGQVVLPPHFLNEAYGYIRKAGGICIADEVQTGCGRPGNYFWAFQEHGVVPDIVTIGKPIGNGHPLGVVVTTQEVANAFRNGMEYFNTFGGNPVSCAIGLEVLKVIRDEGLQENAFMVGNYLRNGLKALMADFPLIGEVRGPGLFIGIELVKDHETKKPATSQASWLANRMRDKGILMSTDGPFNNVLKIKPPIVFSKANADFLLYAFEKVLKEDFMRP